MRIAITNPFCWPWVRRGSERLLNDLSIHLADLGHEVTVISTAPVAALTTEQRGRVRYLLHPQHLKHRLGRRLSMLHVFAWQVRQTLGREDFDAVYCLNHHDAAGAARARGPSGAVPRRVLLLAGIPTFRQLWTRPLDLWMFTRAIRAVDAVQVVSQHAGVALARDFGIAGLNLPPPVHVDRFAQAAQPGLPGRGAADPPARAAPVILFVGDLAERRKGARPLALAFEQLRRRHPGARLRFCGHDSAGIRSQVTDGLAPETVAAIEFLGVGDVAELPAHVAAATVVALPALWEAFGMALVEALAAGRPVVGCRHGGMGDIVTHPGIGRLVAPAPGDAQRGVLSAVDALATALDEAVALAADPATAGRCQDHASRFGWAALGSHYESLITRDLQTLPHPLPRPPDAAHPAAPAPRAIVVIPTWRRLGMLRRLLQSLQAQTYPHDRFEVVVVHRETGDGVPELVAEMAALADVPMRTVLTDYQGPGGSRDAGARATDSPVIAFIDDDCVATPGWLDAGIASLEPGFGLVQGRTRANPGQPRRMLEQTIETEGPTAYFETCNIFYRRAAFEAVGGFSPTYRHGHEGGEDTDLGWKVIEAGWSTGYAPAAVAYHEVWHIGFRPWLLRITLIYGALPKLVSLHPGLRDHLFLRVFLTRFQPLLIVLVTGGIGALTLSPAVAVLALPYAVARYRESHRLRHPVSRLLRVAAALPRAMLGLVVLAWRSARTRCMVL